MRRSTFALSCVLCALVFAGTVARGSEEKNERKLEASRIEIERGFAIAPVALTFPRRDRDLVGLGSYIVNAQAVCNDCHTCPSYAPGHNPHMGFDGQVNAEHYLAGGVAFGPFISPNLTPDPVTGLPDGGHTFQQFKTMIRTGHDVDDGHILQVMPWPVYRNMTDDDLRAIYAFLKAIPHAEPGACTGAGQ